MVTLEKCLCLFALLLASVMSMLLGLVVCNPPAPRVVRSVVPRQMAEPDLRPRLPPRTYIGPASVVP
jgi:hypothetical protein